MPLYYTSTTIIRKVTNVVCACMCMLKDDKLLKKRQFIDVKVDILKKSTKFYGPPVSSKQKKEKYFIHNTQDLKSSSSSHILHQSASSNMTTTQNYHIILKF